jgi:hypothetical protein
MKDVRKVVEISPSDPPFDVQATISNLMKGHRERRGIKSSSHESITEVLLESPVDLSPG